MVLALVVPLLLGQQSPALVPEVTDSTSRFLRAPVVAAAGMATAAAVWGGLTLAFAPIVNQPGRLAAPSESIAIGLTGMLGALPVALVSWAVHRAMGGKSSGLWSLLGTALGAATGAAVIFAVERSSPGGAVPQWAYAVGAAGLAGIGSGTFTELGDLREPR